MNGSSLSHNAMDVSARAGNPVLPIHDRTKKAGHFNHWHNGRHTALWGSPIRGPRPHAFYGAPMQ